MLRENWRYRRGDLYYAALDPVVGSEQGGLRPVLLVQNDVGSRHSSMLIIAPLTTALGKPVLPTHVILPPQRGLQESLVLLEQLRAVDKARIKAYAGHISPLSQRQVDHALQVSVGLSSRCNDEPSVRCLCSVCANHYYNDPAFSIRRLDPGQQTKDVCDFCGFRTGYDFSVRELIKKAPHGAE